MGIMEAAFFDLGPAGAPVAALPPPVPEPALLALLALAAASLLSKRETRLRP